MRIFITATDTGAGKTWLTSHLVSSARSSAYDWVGMKPVVSGCLEPQNPLSSEDVASINDANGQCVAVQHLNQYAWKEAVSPHLAIRCSGQVIEQQKIQQAMSYLNEQHDITLIEGVGGWFAPLFDNGATLSDVIKHQIDGVIVVVPMQLGCINHARLTFACIRKQGFKVLGWIANCIDGMDYQQQNIESISNMGQVELLGVCQKNQKNLNDIVHKIIEVI
ncbi:MAG: dethiobiotin synthase [bacterium]